eukprot:252403_1
MFGNMWMWGCPQPKRRTVLAMIIIYVSFMLFLCEFSGITVTSLIQQLELDPNTPFNETVHVPELHVISYRNTHKCSPYWQKSHANCEKRLRLWCGAVRVNALNNISVNYLGDNPQEPYISGHVLKILDIYKHLKYLAESYTLEQQQHSIIIMFIDGFDTIFQFNSSEVIKRFLQLKSNPDIDLNHKVIWQAEHTCSPGHPRNIDRTIYCNTSLDAYPRPPPNNDGTWLNAGGYIGYLYDVVQNFQEFMDYINTDGAHDAKGEWRGDQEIISLHYINRSEYMYLDYYSYLMQALNEMYDVIKLEEHGWYNPIMNTYPVTLHFNGDKRYIESSERELVNKVFPENDKIDGDFNISLTNYTITRTIKYKDICTEYIDWYY